MQFHFHPSLEAECRLVMLPCFPPAVLGLGRRTAKPESEAEEKRPLYGKVQCRVQIPIHA
jgi:hypothetical protein